MKILGKIANQDFPLVWANLDFFPESKGHKAEVYLIKNKSMIDELILMFYALFRGVKKNIKIYNHSWWDFCLDTWDPNGDKYDYELEGKSSETKDYLIMLRESSIEQGYSGICSCNDWDKFLSIVLTCIVTHRAPFSPVFYNVENDFFFYFHHTGSIGLYYKMKNEIVVKILNTARDEYDIRY